MIKVSVVLATPDRQQLVEVNLPEGSCAWDAVLAALDAGLDVTALAQGHPASHSPDECSGLNKDAITIGVYGRVVEKEHCLGEGDRVELYRPLILDPMEQRRRRALEKGARSG